MAAAGNGGAGVGAGTIRAAVGRGTGPGDFPDGAGDVRGYREACPRTEAGVEAAVDGGGGGGRVEERGSGV